MRLTNVFSDELLGLVDTRHDMPEICEASTGNQTNVARYPIIAISRTRRHPGFEPRVYVRKAVLT